MDVTLLVLLCVGAAIAGGALVIFAFGIAMNMAVARGLGW